MLEVKLKIEKVVDVDQIIKKVVKEKKDVDVSSFYNKKISAEEKNIYIYVFECVNTKMKYKTIGVKGGLVPVTTCITITIIASVKKDSVVVAVIFPSDDNTHDNPPSNSIVDGLKNEGFKVLGYNGYNHY